MRVMLVLLSLVFCTACGQSSNPGRTNNQNILRLNLYTEPPTLDPGLTTDALSFQLLNELFEGLTRIVEGEKPSLAAAESYEVSPDGKTYTFKIRKSCWSNGDPVTAHDFEFAWRRILDPAFPSETAYQMYVIKGAQEVKEQKAPKNILGIHAVDDDTLVVELKNPIPYFLQMLSLPMFLPLNKKVVEAHPDWSYEAGPNYVSNGPFKLESWKHNNELIMVKNPEYWDATAVKLDEIDGLIVEDANTELAMFNDGALDWAGKPISIGLPTDSILALRSSGKLQSAPQAATYMFELNIKVPLLSNVKIRRALALALDRQSIIDNIVQGGEEVATGVLPPSMKLAKQPYFKDADTAQAKILFQEGLKELGISPNKIPSLTINYNTNEGHHKIAQAVQQQWNQVLGLKVNLENLEWKVYLDKLSQKDYQIGRMTWGAAFNDPIDMLDQFKLHNSRANRTGWEDQRFVDLIDESMTERDETRRMELLQQAEQILIEAMPIIPLYHNTTTYLVNPRLKGYYMNPLGYVDFKTAYFEGKESDSD